MYSILQLFGRSSGHCGYCKSPEGKRTIGTDETQGEETSISFGTWAHKMQAKFYQGMLDSGWRRSGKYVYKPIMDETCCPQYTIRLESQKFYLSRSQKRVLRQMKEYLEQNKKPRTSGSGKSEESEKTIPEKSVIKPIPSPGSKSGNLKKKQMRKQRFMARCIERGVDPAEIQKKKREKEDSRRRTVESFLPTNDGAKHDLQVRLVAVNSEEFMTRREESFQLYVKYQDKVHNDKDTSFMGFNRFLVHSPLEVKDAANIQELIDSDSPPYGSYHQWYILDGKLIAVGVLDILPRCVSSKYMFYDPDYSFLNLGTYTALREIAFSRRLFRKRSELKYYYMGYYIPTCVKMRYKGEFRPSELLCDKSLTWIPLSECLILLSSNKMAFTVFRPEVECRRITRDNLLILLNGQVVPYPLLPHFIPSYKEKEPDSAKEVLDDFTKYCSEDLAGFLIYLDAIEKLVEDVTTDEVATAEEPAAEETE